MQNLDEFHSTTCWTPFSYGVLYISVFISISVYAVDIFTAVNLLAFDRWSGQIKPYIPMTYSRWIFAACIILSFIFLFFRWLRAIRVMKRGGVADSYLDPLALYIQSLRMGKEGRGWKRFLVFAELSKGKKGADYVALFTYYSFEGTLQMALRSLSMLTRGSLASHTVRRRTTASHQRPYAVHSHATEPHPRRRQCSERRSYPNHSILRQCWPSRRQVR